MFIDMRERERETDFCQLPPVHAMTGDQTCTLSVCPDQGSNLELFGAQGNVLTESPGQGYVVSYYSVLKRYLKYLLLNSILILYMILLLGLKTNNHVINRNDSVYYY